MSTTAPQPVAIADINSDRKFLLAMAKAIGGDPRARPEHNPARVARFVTLGPLADLLLGDSCHLLGVFNEITPIGVISLPPFLLGVFDEISQIGDISLLP